MKLQNSLKEVQKMSYQSAKTTRTLWSRKSQTNIILAGKSMIADVSGALYWPSEEILIVADPSLKNDASSNTETISLQSHETRATLIKLQDTAEHYQAKRLMLLGCKAETELSTDDLDEENVDRLSDLHKKYDCTWSISGTAPEFLYRFEATIGQANKLNGLTFKHKPTFAPMAREVAGFMNPIAKQKSDGNSIGQKCFVSNNARLIMPSFGSAGAGNNIMNQKFDPLFSAGSQYVWTLGTNDVHPVAARLLQE